jgi:hypothetical protein
MPTPGKNETEKEFIGRCIPFMLKEKPGMEQDQAVAICYSIWREDKKSESIIKRIDKLINESGTTDVENFIRKHLSGTNKKIDADGMWNSFVKKKFDDMDREDFDEVWDSLIDDEYLVKAGGKNYKWSE